MTKERPILFSGEMVRAILEGRKNQTRRVIKPQPCGTSARPLSKCCLQHCPFEVGQRLWVKETFWVQPDVWQQHHGPQPIHYDADLDDPRQVEDYAKHPGIFMPRWASRINLEVTDVRVERVQEISAEDVQAEGIDVIGKLPMIPPPGADLALLARMVAQREFRLLWDSINEERGYGWETNPWVWAITFRLLGGGDGNVEA